MSGQARATLLSGWNKDVQRRQIERFGRWAEAVEGVLAGELRDLDDRSRATDALLEIRTKRWDRTLALLAACVLGGFWQRRRARRELRAMLHGAGKGETLSRETKV